MASDLSPDQEEVLERLVADGRFPDRRRALDRAVELLREESETVDAIREGLASVERGEGVPLDEAVRQLRAKFRIADGS
ncbi:MAG: type II toxin-antitoxin system ParD family antitoxin [Planctomycetia bacterium]|nr:type II toxin-antitoxin system ParD family antitoxin [Planctomycetia bacterium]